MREMMGFEKHKRIVKVMGNVPVADSIGGKEYHYRSKFERNWALYLQFLKETGEIIEWEYEVVLFNFQNQGYETGPFMYRPDFKVTEKDGHILYQECKGWHDGATNRKFQRTLVCYPDISKEDFELVLMRIPKNGKGANNRRIAQKYCRRIINSRDILGPLKGMLNFK